MALALQAPPKRACCLLLLLAVFLPDHLSPALSLLLPVEREPTDEAALAEEDEEAWRPVGPALETEWTFRVDPSQAWQEYPRPQLVRGPNSWRNLNGLWRFAVAQAQGEGHRPSNLAEVTAMRRTGRILVPFSIETSLSGVGDSLRPGEELWYQRDFTLPAGHKPGNRVLLNFEAVDFDCLAFVNGEEVGHHMGGSTPFQFDATRALRLGGAAEHRLLVRVMDNLGGYQLAGKQSTRPGGIWYNTSSGIRGSVWLETVPGTFLKALHVDGVHHSGTGQSFIEVQGVLDGKDLDVHGAALRVRVLDGKNEAAPSKHCEPAVRCQVPVPGAKLWSPASPFLYDLEVTVLSKASRLQEEGEPDQVSSYAGIRTIGTKRDRHGHLRITLNGKFLFQWGVLDQGWWPDGGLTAPSVEAMRSDIDYLKAAGFNVIRKHMKVEPRLYYAYCDRVGMLVWQDHVAAPGCSTGHHPCAKGVSPTVWSRLARGANLRHEAREETDWPPEAHKLFMAEFAEMVGTLRSHPSIVTWVPFNEAWGQHSTLEVGKWLRQLDSTRLIDLASGGNFFPFGDIADEHNYPHASFPTNDTRYKDFVKVVGEFGGLGLTVKGHLTSSRHWGYRKERNTDGLLRQRKAELKVLAGLVGKGVAGAIYTQATDVEHETNGLLTYDRKVQKLSAEDLGEAAALVLAAAARAAE